MKVFVLFINLFISSAFAGTPLQTIDILGVYSPSAGNLIKDTKAWFVSNIEYANRVLENSEAEHRYRLVGVEKVSWENDDTIGGASLNGLTFSTTVQKLRKRYKADAVSGLVPTSNGFCGIGWLTNPTYTGSETYAYSLTGHSCLGRTLAHEIGHNLGLGHSKNQGSTGIVVPYGLGYGVQNNFVTVMAYPSAYGGFTVSQIQIHSNPDISECNSLPCGVHSEADATKALNLVSDDAANWFKSNSALVAVDDFIKIQKDTITVIDVLANDLLPDSRGITNDTVYFHTAPQAGRASLNDRRSIKYWPPTNFVGTDTFQYLSVGYDKETLIETSRSNWATVTISIVRKVD